MIILTENNYKRLANIPRIKNPDKNPDIVFYPKIFDESTNTQIVTILNSLHLKGCQLWLADDPSWIFDKNVPIHPFPDIIDKLREDIEVITNKKFNTCLINKYNTCSTTFININQDILADKFTVPIVCIGTDTNMIFTSTIDDAQKSIKITNGSLILQRKSVKKYWKYDLDNNTSNTPFYILTFYRSFFPQNPILTCQEPRMTSTVRLPYDLGKIYLKSKLRKTLAKKIKKGLSMIHSVSDGSQCFMKNGINEVKRYIKLGKLIGQGDWGNVYSACLPDDTSCKRKFAIKMARISDEDFNDPYTETSIAWYEIWMLKDIIKPLIDMDICPNLPFYIDTFLCDKCDFIFRTGYKQHPCVTTVMELATGGDMKDYLRYSRLSDDEIYSALFQIMAGLHAIQMSGQILNYDIKATNILVYNVTPGGYWHYKIGKNNFYVPNYGKMLVLNDFGVSTLYNPNFQLYPNKSKQVFNLGSRFAINIDGIFSPIEAKTEWNKKLIKSRNVSWIDSQDGTLYNTSKGVTYKLDRKSDQVIISHTTLSPIQKSYLFRKGISTNPKTWGFFEHPYVIPPFEFYNDVQDALRIFTGGFRSTQKGSHTVFNSVSKEVRKSIEPYKGIAKSSTERKFSVYAYQVLAGEFITKFFTETKNYTNIPKGKKIAFYDMNKCMNTKII